MEVRPHESLTRRERRWEASIGCGGWCRSHRPHPRAVVPMQADDAAPCQLLELDDACLLVILRAMEPLTWCNVAQTCWVGLRTARAQSRLAHRANPVRLQPCTRGRACVRAAAAPPDVGQALVAGGQRGHEGASGQAGWPCVPLPGRGRLSQQVGTGGAQGLRLTAGVWVWG